MNLALKDIRHNLGRFALTAMGIGILLMVVMGMFGIYRGLVEDATLLVESIGADLWVAQKGTSGPFAELSRLPWTMVDRVRAIPGVRTAREFVYHTVQQRVLGRSVRFSIVGLSWPVDRGLWLPIVAGRPLTVNHYEMVADEQLGLAIGTRVELGGDPFTVVGITRGMISSGGDGLAFLTARDAQAVQFDLSGEARRLERSARQGRMDRAGLDQAGPALVERAGSPSSTLPFMAPPPVSAVLVSTDSRSDVSRVQAVLAGWMDVTASTMEHQRQLLLTGNVDRSRRQIGLFTALLTTISAGLMALILYTLTLEKVHSIALLKLIGAPGRVVVGMILQQALILGAVGYGVAFFLGREIFPRFPRRVVIDTGDLIRLAFMVLGISVVSSLLGILKAVRVDPNQALEG